MKISIVTISFNQAKYLKDCIESVLSQDYKNIEYIVVDPGSTDGSQEIISSYGDRIITVFEKDDGPADGLNKGFARASGDIFYFLNADDYLEKNSIKSVMDAFSENKDIDVIIGNGFIDHNGDKKIVYPDLTNLNRLLLRACKIFQQGTFFRRAIFVDAGGFNKLNRTCWDYELFINFSNNNAKIMLIDASLAAFRIHDDSISGSGRLRVKYIEDLERIYFDITGKKWGLKSRSLSLATRLTRYIGSRLSRNFR